MAPAPEPTSSAAGDPEVTPGPEESLGALLASASLDELQGWFG